MQAMIVERVKAQLKDRSVAQVFEAASRRSGRDRCAGRRTHEVREEILGLANVRAKTMERPQFTVAFEANRLFGAERWLGRTRVGIGVWKLTLALSAAVGRVCRGGACDDGVKGFIGPEVVLHILTSKQPRATVDR